MGNNTEVAINESWYRELTDDAKNVIHLILKYHEYFKKQDVKYRRIVHILKICVLILAMISTLVLGLKSITNINFKLDVGLCISATITLLTAVSSYFNFEKYWMRNITIHIKLNTLRDNFIFEAEADRIDGDRTQYYMTILDEIQNANIRYWENAIQKM
jgi:hypothetical protein